MLLQSPVSSAKRLQKDKLLMTARVKLTRLSAKNQQHHRTRILIQPKVDPEDVRSELSMIFWVRVVIKSPLAVEMIFRLDHRFLTSNVIFTENVNMVVSNSFYFRSRMLPSSVSYPSILPLVAHIERTKEELLDRNCDSPLPVYNDPPVRVRKGAKKTKSSSYSSRTSAASNNNKSSSEKSTSKDSGVNVDGEEDDELDLECRICRKKGWVH